MIRYAEPEELNYRVNVAAIADLGSSGVYLDGTLLQPAGKLLPRHRAFPQQGLWDDDDSTNKAILIDKFDNYVLLEDPYKDGTSGSRLTDILEQHVPFPECGMLTPFYEHSRAITSIPFAFDAVHTIEELYALQPERNSVLVELRNISKMEYGGQQALMQQFILQNRWSMGIVRDALYTALAAAKHSGGLVEHERDIYRNRELVAVRGLLQCTVPCFQFSTTPLLLRLEEDFRYQVGYMDGYICPVIDVYYGIPNRHSRRSYYHKHFVHLIETYKNPILQKRHKRFRQIG